MFSASWGPSHKERHRKNLVYQFLKANNFQHIHPNQSEVRGTSMNIQKPHGFATGMQDYTCPASHVARISSTFIILTVIGVSCRPGYHFGRRAKRIQKESHSNSFWNMQPRCRCGCLLFFFSLLPFLLFLCWFPEANVLALHVLSHKGLSWGSFFGFNMQADAICILKLGLPKARRAKESSI